ncbi:hypothetical protein ADK43_38110 [Streptomyces rimosus subsp. rimosus]|nr:hypothetical protein ADK43_38110 [Streptomyces rimosus subsp. rimosus]
MRSASDLPVTIIKPALQYYARHGLGLELNAATFATVYYDMAAKAPTVYSRWNGQPGEHLLADSDALIWQLATRGPRKPVITGVLPPRGHAADVLIRHRTGQRPGRATRAHRRRS